MPIPYFGDELKKYFPDVLADQYFKQMQNHRLHREIISTFLTNSIVNRLGIETIYRLYSDTQQPLDVIVRAYTVTRDVYDVPTLWQKLESLDNQLDAELLLELETKLRASIERSIMWLIDRYGPTLNVATL